MSAEEKEFLPPEEVAENIEELASDMEKDVTDLREVSEQIRNGELTVAEAYGEGAFDLRTDERL